MIGKKHKQETIEKIKAAKLGKYSGVNHPKCSVTVSDVFTVRNLRASTSMTCKEIAEKTHISYHVVRNIVYQKSWKSTYENT